MRSAAIPAAGDSTVSVHVSELAAGTPPKPAAEDGLRYASFAASMPSRETESVLAGAARHPPSSDYGATRRPTDRFNASTL